KIRYKECKRELAKTQSAYDEKVLACDQLEKSLHERVEELEEEKREAEQLTSE
ncbi:hypothetical protein Tco_1280578, partial [Tanacetum coccineum]